MSKHLGNIFLAWRKGPGERRIIVGELRSNSSDGVRFSYVQKNIEKAKKQGFTEFIGFPNTEEQYSENVLDIFAQRLVKSERNDVSDFYEFWKVDKLRIQDAYYMLAQTQALLPIDNFELLADFNPVKGLSFISEIAGLGRSKLSASELGVGDMLSYDLEAKNPQDSKAVKLFKGQKELGYVKVIHSRIFHKSKRDLSVKVHHIEKSDIIKRVFIEISL